jgi:hypothetical protein
VIDDAELAALEGQVQAALAAADTGALRVLGYGEITLVLGWPPADPRVACKRLPVFRDPRRAAAYGETVTEYIGALAQRGVVVVPSEWRTVALRDGIAAYVVQPVLPAAALAPNVARSELSPVDLLERVVRTIAETVDVGVGLDGQLSNWAVVDDELRYFDVTTPMLAGDDGTRLDLDLLVQPLPAVIRAAVRRWVAPGIVARYHRPRDVLVDLVGNLLKERIDVLVDPVIEIANRHVTPTIDRDEVERWYRSDARTWEALLRLRRADRWWQRHVRRRPYPFLLPGRIER